MTKTIVFKNGLEAFISDCDEDRVSQHQWHTFCVRGIWYAATGRKDKPRRLYLHRFIMDAPEGMEADHRDGNGLNNQRDNLRLCTHAENLRNRGKQANGSSGYKGVTYFKGGNLWRAQIKLNGKSIGLGVYNTAEQAAIAYNHAAKDLFGDFAVFNDVKNWESLIPRRRNDLRITNKSGYRGAHWSRDTNKWRVKFNGKHIGLYDDLIEAATAYDEVSFAALGDRAKLNFVKQEEN